MPPLSTTNNLLQATEEQGIGSTIPTSTRSYSPSQIPRILLLRQYLHPVLKESVSIYNLEGRLHCQSWV